MIIINCFKCWVYDLWSQSGASWGVTLDFQRHLSCGFGSLLYLGFRCLHHAPDTPFPSPTPSSPPPHPPPPPLSTVHLWSLSFPPPSICTSAFHWGPHVSEDLNTLNAGTSKVSLWHLTQRLGDLKGRGENYRRWSVTKIKNRPRLPPITLNNAVQAICWSDGGLVLSVEDCRKERDSFRETGT